MKEVFTSETISDLNRQIEAFMEDHDVYDWNDVTIIISKTPDNVDLKSCAGEGSYHWRGIITPNYVKEAMKDLLVREYGVVEMFWDKESIIELASNDNRRDLTEAEVDRIAQRLANADCEYGISWQTIREETLAVCPDAVSMDREEFFEDEEDMDDDSDEFHYMRANYSEEPEQ